MATKVYQSGIFIIVDKTGEPPVLKIPINKAKYTFFALAANNQNNEIATFDRVSIGYDSNEIYRLDTVTEIQDSIGTPIGGYQDVKKYLGNFINSGNAAFLTNPLDCSGGGSGLSNLTITYQNTDYTASAGDFVIVTTGAGNITITLPPIVSSENVEIAVKKNDGSGLGNVIVTGNGSETIDGNLSVTITSAPNSITFQGGYTEWEMK